MSIAHRYFAAAAVCALVVWAYAVIESNKARSLSRSPRKPKTAERTPAFRQSLLDRAGWGLENDPVAADLNRAILLGERGQLAPETREVFLTAGTMHLFAISGLHVMVVAQIVAILFSLCGLPPRIVSALMIPALWFYVMIVGWSPSAVRAAAMASFYFAARICGRQANALIAWASAFIVIHLVSPLSILKAGSILSFAVMLGIILSLRRRTPEEERPAAFSLCRISLAAWAAGTPIVAQIFGRITPGGIIANLVLVPLAGADVAAGFTGLLASFVCPWLARLLNGLSALILKLMFAISWCVAKLPGASFEIENWTLCHTLLWYAAVFAAVFSVRKFCEYRKARI